MRAKTAEVLQGIDERLKALERTALVQTSPIKTPVPHARVESFQTEAPDVVKSLKARLPWEVFDYENRIRRT